MKRLSLFTNFLFGILILPASVRAQREAIPDSSRWEVSAAVTGSVFRVRDDWFSRRVSYGEVPGGRLSVAWVRPRSFHAMEIKYSGGSLSGDAAVGPKEKYLAADYMNLRRLFSRSDSVRWKLWVGAALDFAFAHREYTGFENNGSDFETILSLGPVAEASVRLGKKRSPWLLSDRLTIPFISWLVQPPYGGPSTKEDNTNRLVGFRYFVRLDNRLSLSRGLGSGRIAVFYDWDYYQVTRPRSVRQAVHQVGFSYTYTF